MNRTVTALLLACVGATDETLWLMKRVGAPTSSPGRRWVVFP